MIFLIEGIISMGIAIISWFVLADRPEVCGWLTAEEKGECLSVARLALPSPLCRAYYCLNGSADIKRSPSAEEVAKQTRRSLTSFSLQPSPRLESRLTTSVRLSSSTKSTGRLFGQEFSTR